MKVTTFWRAVERKLDGRSWKWLADQMGLPEGRLYAAREHEPKYAVVLAVAEALGLTPNDLMDEILREGESK